MNRKVLSHQLSEEEIRMLKHADVPVYLSTIDKEGYPRITPLWFIWEHDSFYMTSVENKFHLKNIACNSKVSICIQVEAVQSGIHRPNSQIKAIGIASIAHDENGAITRKINQKYLTGPDAEAEIERRCSVWRHVVQLTPERIFGFGGGKKA